MPTCTVLAHWLTEQVHQHKIGIFYRLREVSQHFVYVELCIYHTYCVHRHMHNLNHLNPKFSARLWNKERAAPEAMYFQTVCTPEQISRYSYGNCMTICTVQQSTVLSLCIFKCVITLIYTSKDNIKINATHVTALEISIRGRWLSLVFILSEPQQKSGGF